ncbi:hypothetical protein L9F63_013500 [Diploptera punctata]|uniref:rhomboid protease n=1 Tax=Diploptera punctata TaxID=6984 RepID=A0AAD8A9V6_DIPPU|nr:hypothetical protein L9F63_013500 [Diploptera punctata]
MPQFPNACLLAANGKTGRLSTSFINAVRGFKTERGFKTSVFERILRRISKPKITPFDSITIDEGPFPPSRLWKPLGFTVLVCSGTFVCAAIWQYENMRARAIALMKQRSSWIQDKYHNKKKIDSWWNGLTEADKIFLPIFFLNCWAFSAWRFPQLQGTMLRYFCSNPTSRILCWPMILCTFSHYSILHLFANMLGMYFLLQDSVVSMGKEQVFALFLIGGVISSMASYVHRVFSVTGLSLGASGAVLAIFGYFCIRDPDKDMCLIFMPFFTFSADTALCVQILLDVAGIILGWRRIDHAAHLGGTITGIAWSFWGNTYYNKTMHWWHELTGGQ